MSCVGHVLGRGLEATASGNVGLGAAALGAVAGVRGRSGAGAGERSSGEVGGRQVVLY